MTVHKVQLFPPGLLLAVLVLSGNAAAQTSTATLRGSVKDEQGAVLPGVSVTARQIETNASRSTVTGSVGQYFLPNLPSGRYEITCELSGFSTAKRTDVVLIVGQEATLDFVLRNGQDLGVDRVIVFRWQHRYIDTVIGRTGAVLSQIQL